MIKKCFPLFVILICSSSLFFSCRTTQTQSEPETIYEEPETIYNESDIIHNEPEIIFEESDTYEYKESTTDFLEMEETEFIPNYLSRKLRDTGRLTAPQLAYYFCQMNPEADIIHIINFAFYYIQEAGEEGINSDVAFAQMCLETGYLRFGNLVQPEFHNYCGLGAMDAEHPGEVFETERLGVRAHIQHLHAYATHEDELLNNELIDPRYSWVHKTKYTEDIEGLTGTWATDPRYAKKIEGILQNMEQLFNQ